MSEPNPYEPPQTPAPLKPAQIAKRGLGVVAILLLTPVAVGIALLTSCGAVMVYGEWANQVRLPDSPAIAIGCVVFLIPPLLTLSTMLYWAYRVDWRRIDALRTKRPK